MQGSLVKYGPLARHVAFITGTKTCWQRTLREEDGALLRLSEHTTASWTVEKPRGYREYRCPFQSHTTREEAQMFSWGQAGHPVRVKVYGKKVWESPGGYLFLVCLLDDEQNELLAVCRSLVQTLLSSSHQGYGVGSLDKDAEEIHLLAKHLKNNCNSQAVVLMGHSTGCQDAVRYAAKYGKAEDGPPVLGYILQAPTSDREAFSLSNIADDLKQERLIAAQLMASNGEGEEVLFRDPDMENAPICARRYLSLVSKNGDDDMFSSDFSNEELKEKLKPLAVAPSLLLIGAIDEFVPKTIDKELMAKRMENAIGATAKALVLPGGNHKLEGQERALVQQVETFLSRIEQA